MVSCESSNAGCYKFCLVLNTFHLGKDLRNLSNQGALDVFIISKKIVNIQRVEEWFEMGLRISPFVNEPMNVDILIVEEDHAHSGDSSRGSIKKGVSFKDEASSVREIDTFAGWKSEEMVVVENTIK